MMLVVVLLLLPVLMTGASLEVPGAGCSVQNCCVLANCHGHAEEIDAIGQHADGHHHHSHRHERILLLNDAGQRTDCRQVAIPAAGVPRLADVCLSRTTPVVLRPLVTGPPPYGGYALPLRC